MLVLDIPWSFKLKHSYLVVTENLAFLLWFCSNVNLTLEQLCMEGNRKQAKYAVSAIATLTADSGLKALSVLYGRLVDQLEDSAHLPTVLQSLGCIAQNANPIFETREEEVIKFVVRNVLRRSIEQVYAISWDSLC
jgi:sister-chromatid-cohesion protein PDS5